MSLTQRQAQARSKLISVDTYHVHLDFTLGSERFGSTTKAIFHTDQPGTSTFIELTHGTDVNTTFNGAELVDRHYSEGQVQLDNLTETNEVTVSATLPFAPDGDGMHRFEDPADNEAYIAGFAGMDVAQKMFACFDQPDLKAKIALSVTAPAEWTVRGNGELVNKSTEDEKTTWEFSTTEPISTYLFVVCAGPWVGFEWEHAGKSFGWHARKSLHKQLLRDEEELKFITNQCYDYYAEVFDEPYPFGHYHQIFAPGLNWGALETPGLVTYRDELLFLGDATEAQTCSRSVVIAHEMSHMWFGNLATMTWWEDTWLQESFADFMGFLVSHKVANNKPSWASFTLGRKMAAYRADRCTSTHPIAPGANSVPDVDAALGIFDQISYGKGTSALRQLVSWLGEEDFFKGLNLYLTRYAFKNAELNDLIDALAESTTADVRGWAKSWLETTGYDTLCCGGTPDAPTISRVGSRPHRVTLEGYQLEGDALVLAKTQVVSLDSDEPLDLPEFAGLVVLPNADDQTFAALTLRESDREAFSSAISTVDCPGSRAVFWWSMLDGARAGTFPVQAVVDAAVSQLATEDSPTIFDFVINQLTALMKTQLPHASYAQQANTLADMCLARINGTAPDSQLVSARAHLELTANAANLQSALQTGVLVGDYELSQDLRWLAIVRLAVLGGITAEAIDVEYDLDKGARGLRESTRAKAALPTAEAKQRAFDSIFEADQTPNNRLIVATLQGLWQPEHADVLASFEQRYFEESSSLAGSSLGLGNVIGRLAPTYAASPVLISQLEKAIAPAADGVPPIPASLRRMWSDTLDDVRSAVATHQLNGR